MIAYGVEVYPNTVSTGQRVSAKVYVRPYSIATTSDNYQICTSDSYYPMVVDNPVISIFEFPFGDSYWSELSEIILESGIDVWFEINDVRYKMLYSSEEDCYSVQFTAPITSSWSQYGHKYRCTISVETPDEDLLLTYEDFEDLELRVIENTPPDIVPVYPESGASIRSKTPTIEWNVIDSNSGVDAGSVSIRIDNGETIKDGITPLEIIGGYRFSFPVEDDLQDGVHAIYLNAKDNDGNSAVQTIVNFIVDQRPPEILSIQITPNPVSASNVFSVNAVVSD